MLGAPGGVYNPRMTQFVVNQGRLDPYKNFKFRLKWDGRRPTSDLTRALVVPHLDFEMWVRNMQRKPTPRYQLQPN
jgi:hypothetical protein